MSGATDMQEIRSVFCKPVLSQLRKVRVAEWRSGVYDRTHCGGKDIHVDQVLVTSVTGAAAQMSVL